MKKLLLMSNAGWLLVSLLIAGIAMKKPAEMQQPPAQKPCFNCDTAHFYGVDGEDFLKSVARYRKYHFETVTNLFGNLMTGGNQDARSCWYSVDTLKKFICLLEKYVANSGASAISKNLGIRFYYADYNKDQVRFSSSAPGFAPIGQSLAMRHTLFLVPTYNPGGGEVDVDFDPRALYESTRFEVNPLHKAKTKITQIPSLWDTYKANPHTVLFIMGTSSSIASSPKQPSTVSVQNQGYLCPPNCPASEISLMNSIDNTWPDTKITQN